MEQNISTTQIEELRRRAKDNKAKNAEYYLTLSFNSANELRTLLFTIPTLAFGYVQSGIGKVNDAFLFKTFFILSIGTGLISYFIFWQASLSQSKHYSKREQILSMAFPTKEQYKKMLEDENEIINKHNNHKFSVSFIGILIQIVFLVLMLIYF